MQMRMLGTTDLRVSPVGLGCWQFSKGAGLMGRYWPELPDPVSREIVRRSLDGGVNWFDTAEAYGWGTSEQVLAESLTTAGKMPGDVVIATKWWPAFRTSRSIGRTIGKRLRRLGGFPIDLYQIHQPLGLSSVEEEMDAMASLMEAGSIRYAGVSNFSEALMRRADRRLRTRGFRLVSNQVSYSLLHRDIESNGILESAKELGVSVISYSPLSQGLLSGKYHGRDGSVRRVKGIRRYLPGFSPAGLEKTRPLVNHLDTIAQAHASTIAQVALQWLVSFNGSTVVAIPGAASPAQAEENAAAMNLTLSGDELASIDAESRLLMRRPLP